MEQGKINEDLLTPKRADLTKSQLQELVNYEIKKDSIAKETQDKFLINICVTICTYSLTKIMG